MSEPTFTNDGVMIISDELRELLVCPIDKAALDLVDSTLVCTRCARIYPIKNGIPDMLVDDAQ